MNLYVHSLIGLSLISLFILIIRKLFANKLSKRFIYGLWLAVPVFLITLPFIRLPQSLSSNFSITSASSVIAGLFQADTSTDIDEPETAKTEVTSSSKSVDSTKETGKKSVMNVAAVNETNKSATAGQVNTPNTSNTTSNKSNVANNTFTENEKSTDNINNTTQAVTQTASAKSAKTISIGKTIRKTIRMIIVITYLIIVSFLLIMLFMVNTRYIASCKRKRKLLFHTEKTGLCVYHLESITSPFIMGRSIYLPSFMTEEEQIRYAVLHEEGHFKHGDSLWVIVRFTVLTIFFYNPIVWMAFFASGRDCELACDEEVLKQIHENERKHYGACLLGIIKKRQSMTDSMVLSTGMSAGKRSMKERIENIMARNKKSRFAMAVTVALMVAITGCGYQTNNKSDDNKASTKESNTSDNTTDNTEAQSDNTEEKTDTTDTDIKDTANEKKDDKDTSADNTEGREITDEEKTLLSTWASDKGNYGFLFSTYDDPKDANYYEVFYSGADIDSQEDIPNEKLEEDYLKITGFSEVLTDISVFKKSDVNDFLNKKVGLSIDDINLDDYEYSPTYDAYYFQHGDTNYTSFTCTGGTVSTDNNGNEIYTATFVPESMPDKTSTATLKKDGSDYKILSCKSNMLTFEDETSNTDEAQEVNLEDGTYVCKHIADSEPYKSRIDNEGILTYGRVDDGYLIISASIEKKDSPEINSNTTEFIPYSTMKIKISDDFKIFSCGGEADPSEVSFDFFNNSYFISDSKCSGLDVIITIKDGKAEQMDICS